MLFNSLEFLLFFPIVTLGYFLTPGKWRWVLLLIASFWFYMSFIPWYVLILVLAIAVDYSAAIFIEDSKTHQRRKTWLVISILSTVAILFVFKYFNFFAENANQLAKMIGWNYSPILLRLALPIGLSFHTFQSLSYVIEVYRGNYKAERHLGIYSLYVMFYPQLVAGPIERPLHLLPQLRAYHPFDWDNFNSGLLRMLWGFFKKMVIADRLSIYVNSVYLKPEAHAGMNSWIVMYFFAIQIYCDFSGYSDIAIGAGQVMGIRMAENFRQPYFAKTIREFWHRWHISLSTWFRDYVYFSLGGNRGTKLNWILALMATFVLSGFWHGANWTFIIWGAIHGVLLLLNSFIGDKKKGNFLTGIITFQLVCFAWIFFRAPHLHDAEIMFKNLLSFKNTHTPFNTDYECLSDMLTLIICVPFMLFIEGKYGTNPINNMVEGKTLGIKWGVTWLMIFMFLNFAVFKNPQSFIYFQF